MAPKAPPKVFIVGGGFAGIAADYALRLDAWPRW